MKTKKEALGIVSKIAKRIDELGGQSFFVGGCVRDELLNRENDDLDIEIYGLTKEQIQNLLTEFGEVKIIGEKFGVFNLSHYDIDFSLPRKDNKVGLKHTDFEVIADPNLSYEEAASRRDFTMNAIMKNVLTGEYVDPFNGIKDLQNKLIRHVNEDHFAEDPLRVLRAARFASQLDFSIAPETIEICKKIDLKDLSSERILKETDKAIMSKKPSRYFNTLKQMNQLKYWFTPIEQMIGLIQNKDYHLEDAYTHTMMVIDEASKVKGQTENPKPFMYAALCHDFGKIVTTDEKGRAIGHEKESPKIAEEFLTKIKADNRTIKYVKELSLQHMTPAQYWGKEINDSSVRKMLDNAYSRNDLKWLSYADQQGMIKGPKSTTKDIEFTTWYDNVNNAFEDWLKKDHLTGKDLIELGYTPSKQFSLILNEARNQEYTKDFDAVIKDITKKYQGNDSLMRSFLKTKGYDARTKQEKMLDSFKEHGYCLDMQEVKSTDEIIEKATNELCKEFRDQSKYMKYDEYVESRLNSSLSNTIKHFRPKEKTVNKE